MEHLLESGIDINVRDTYGRTALFHVIVPNAGVPDLFCWLLSCGADVNLRDHAGQSAIEFARDQLSSGLEENMLAEILDFALCCGYRMPGNGARAAAEFYGDWQSLRGVPPQSDKNIITIATDHIASSSGWPAMIVQSCSFRADGLLTLSGERAEEQVLVHLELLAPARALFTWIDAIAPPVKLLISR